MSRADQYNLGDPVFLVAYTKGPGHDTPSGFVTDWEIVRTFAGLKLKLSSYTAAERSMREDRKVYVCVKPVWHEMTEISKEMIAALDEDMINTEIDRIRKKYD
jgi:hypothetical protein